MPALQMPALAIESLHRSNFQYFIHNPSILPLITCDSAGKALMAEMKILWPCSDRHAPDVCDGLSPGGCLLSVILRFGQERSQHHHPLLAARLQSPRPSRACRQPRTSWITWGDGSDGFARDRRSGRQRWGERRKRRQWYFFSGSL